ncbi:MAG TPA: hypothetical protein VE153_26375 [Myxococcus sp.]|nr:hypothetical protein [Myxococcus sp.]
MKKQLAAALFAVVLGTSTPAAAYYENTGHYHHWWSNIQPNIFVQNYTGRTLLFACAGYTATPFYHGQTRACSPAHAYIANDGQSVAGVAVYYCNAQWQCS